MEKLKGKKRYKTKRKKKTGCKGQRREDFEREKEGKSLGGKGRAREDLEERKGWEGKGCSPFCSIVIVTHQDRCQLYIFITYST